MLQLILFNSVRQPYVFSVQCSREYASRAPYKWSLSSHSLFSRRIISLKLDSRVRRRQYMLRLRIWSPRVIALSPGTPAKRCPSIFPFYGGVKCVETHNSAAEAYKILIVPCPALLPARKSQVRITACAYHYIICNSHTSHSKNLVNRKMLGSRATKYRSNVSLRCAITQRVFNSLFF